MSPIKEYQLAPDTDLIEYCYEQGWSDGLPVVPPTKEKVMAMLATTPRQPDEVMGHVPIRKLAVTVEQVAVNAVMAGCLPAYFPVVLAAVDGMLAPEFGAEGPTASTVGVGTMVIVHGPVARALGVKCRNNLFGPGVRANATIGRAAQLVWRNLLGATPGVTEMATLGHPGKYTYCIAEDEENSCWAPYHVDRGFRPDESAVTVFGAHAPCQVNNRMSRQPEGILDSMAYNIGRLGLHRFGLKQYLVVMGYEHMLTMKEFGWSKERVRQYLFEKSVQTMSTLKRTGMVQEEVEPGDEDRIVHAMLNPDDIHVVVAGGLAGRYSAVCDIWGHRDAHRPVTRPVQFKG